MSTLENESKTATSARKIANCVHHWIIDAPNGRESVGSCKHCGVSKGFSNSTESVMWEQTNTLRNDVREAARFSKPAEIRLSDES
jgi:hypothetical protein